ncbi:Flp pilus assembly complex ATPase component TadA [bacterium]|nr:Flp pilus assembly complex ATPase component TadA [bacterium]
MDMSTTSGVVKKTFTEMLIEHGTVTPSQLEKARRIQLETGGKLPDVLEQLGYVSKEVLAQHISDNYDIPKIKLSLDLIDPDVVKMVSPELARNYKVIPIMMVANILTVAMADPLDLIAIDTMKMASGQNIEPVICTEDEILEAIDFIFGKEEKPLRVHEPWRDTNVEFVRGEDDEQSLRDQEVEDAPIVRLVSVILSRAIDDGAGDVHIEPAEDLGRVRFRQDGVLHEVNVLPRHVPGPLISRIKVLSSLDITEKRIPQDGRFFVRYNQRNVDLRVATLPTIYGESCVIRLLDQSKSDIQLENLGLTEDQWNLIVGALGKTSGLVLVTGPTGSGKTTTLCAMLNYVNSLEKKIITLEDPVEYRMKIVNQVTINPVVGLTYAAGLRSILRSDPDIVLVGEIRDRESAVIAVQAALTGHLLLSTLHTTGTAETLMRLLDLGVDPFYVREVVELILAQRLVRVLCDHCKEDYRPSTEVRALLGNIDADATLFKPVGCAECHNTGFRGRTAVYEILRMTDTIRAILKPETTAHSVKELARKEGMTIFWEAAVEKVLQGATSVEEISKYVPGSVRIDSGDGSAANNHTTGKNGIEPEEADGKHE